MVGQHILDMGMLKLTSTVDICIQTPMKRLEEMHPLAEALDKRALFYIAS
jgi:hypothetical protein